MNERVGLQVHRISVFTKDGKVVGVFDDIDRGGSVPEQVRVETTPVVVSTINALLALVDEHRRTL